MLYMYATVIYYVQVYNGKLRRVRLNLNVSRVSVIFFPHIPVDCGVCSF